MKQRILLIVVLLLIATPAFAGVNIDVTQGSGADVNKLTVRYDCNAAEKVRAFALNLSLGSAGNSMTFAGVNDINDFNRGESNKPGGGYGIFPGQFRNNIDPANPNWFAQYYTPIPPDGDVDSNGTGFGKRSIIAELGTLYKDTNNPGTSGILFSIRVDQNSLNTDTLTVSANTVRGGIVLESGATATDTNLPVTKTISFGPPPQYTISGQVVGANAPKLAGISGVVMSGLPGNPVTNATGDYTATVDQGWSGTSTPTDSNVGQWTFAPTSFTYTNVTSNQTGQNVTGTAQECLNALDPGYVAWKSTTWNKPACWCNRRQCRGDINGTKSTYWVQSGDLAIFRSTFNKSDTVVATVTNGICADLNHSKSTYRVQSTDLGIFRSYLNKGDALVPECNLAPFTTGARYNKWNN